MRREMDRLPLVSRSTSFSELLTFPDIPLDGIYACIARDFSRDQQLIAVDPALRLD